MLEPLIREPKKRVPCPRLASIVFLASLFALIFGAYMQYNGDNLEEPVGKTLAKWIESTEVKKDKTWVSLSCSGSECEVGAHACGLGTVVFNELEEQSIHEDDLEDNPSAEILYGSSKVWKLSDKIKLANRNPPRTFTQTLAQKVQSLVEEERNFVLEVSVWPDHIFLLNYVTPDDDNDIDGGFQIYQSWVHEFSLKFWLGDENLQKQCLSAWEKNIWKTTYSSSDKAAQQKEDRNELVTAQNTYGGRKMVSADEIYGLMAQLQNAFAAGQSVFEKKDLDKKQENLLKPDELPTAMDYDKWTTTKWLGKDAFHLEKFQHFWHKIEDIYGKARRGEFGMMYIKFRWLYLKDDEDPRRASRRNLGNKQKNVVIPRTDRSDPKTNKIQNAPE